jgi:hypothetical protein
MIIKRRIGQPGGGAKIGVIGKIKIGEIVPAQNGKTRPSSIDYFKPDADDQYKAMFVERYGEKPDKISIVFLSNDLSEVCRNYYELRDTSGKRIAYGDGERFFVATVQTDRQVRDVETVPQNPDAWMDEMASRSKTQWRETLTMRFAIAGIPVFGVWQFSTHGKESSISNILGAVLTAQDIAGRIAGIPFDLSISMVTGDKAGQTSRYPVVSMVANLSPESLESVRQLPAGSMQLLSERRISELSTGSIHDAPGPSSESDPFTDFEEVQTVDEPYTPKATTAAEFNAERARIIEVSKSDFNRAKEMALLLGDRAQMLGISKNEKGEYTQP